MPTGATARPNDESGPRHLPAPPEPFAPRHPVPFAWQDGRRLWILDGGDSDWVLAEMIFDPVTCRYLEVRRASYRWPREAAGALLGRTFASGQTRVEDVARGLSEWATRAGQSR